MRLRRALTSILACCMIVCSYEYNSLVKILLINKIGMSEYVCSAAQRHTVGRKSAFIDLGILFCKCQFLCWISLLLVITIYKNDTRIDSAQKRRNYNFFTKILYGASMKNRNISKTAGITLISL